MSIGADIATSGPAGASGRALSFDERVEQVVAVIDKQPLHREILHRTLGFCDAQRPLTEVEEEIATYPEFVHATQDQFHLIGFLVDAGGLECVELDITGEAVTEAMRAGLSEDEVDDLVVAYVYVTTDAGTAARERLDPRRRIRELLDREPESAAAFARVHTYCAEPRSYAEIEAFLAGVDGTEGAPAGDVAGRGATIDDAGPHPSFYVGQLERAGALIWSDAWTLSDEGRALLESVADRS